MYFIFSLTCVFQSRLSVLFLSFFLLLATESHAAKNPYAGIPRVKLTLIYHHDIFCSDECRKHTIDGCLKITGQLNRLTCREEVQLIRPKKLAELWIKKQHQQGYIDLTLKEAGIEHARAHIISITPSVLGRLGKDSNAQWVTGIFKRHALNTGDYTFKNTDTGQLSIIHATPNHRFYLKNRRTFLPVGDITEKDTLVTVNGNSVKLVNSRANTGITGDRKANIPVWTYNLEIWKKHTYFAGSDKILVHNTCRCGICEEELDNPVEVRVHSDSSGRRCRPINYLCGLDGCKKKTIRIDYMNSHQLENHGVYNPYSCPLCCIQFDDMDLLEKHLEFICDYERLIRVDLEKIQSESLHSERYHPYEIQSGKINAVVKKHGRRGRPPKSLPSTFFSRSGQDHPDEKSIDVGLFKRLNKELSEIQSGSMPSGPP